VARVDAGGAVRLKPQRSAFALHVYARAGFVQENSVGPMPTMHLSTTPPPARWLQDNATAVVQGSSSFGRATPSNQGLIGGRYTVDDIGCSGVLRRSRVGWASASRRVLQQH
jgi:hypothetical protein